MLGYWNWEHNNGSCWRSGGCSLACKILCPVILLADKVIRSVITLFPHDTKILLILLNRRYITKFKQINLLHLTFSYHFSFKSFYNSHCSYFVGWVTPSNPNYKSYVLNRICYLCFHLLINSLVDKILSPEDTPFLFFFLMSHVVHETMNIANFNLHIPRLHPLTQIFIIKRPNKSGWLAKTYQNNSYINIF